MGYDKTVPERDMAIMCFILKNKNGYLQKIYSCNMDKKLSYDSMMDKNICFGHVPCDLFCLVS
jgi:hypothetical protein